MKFGAHSIGLILISALSLNAHAPSASTGAQESKASVVILPGITKLSPSATAAWIFYAASRIQFRNQHNLPIPAAKEGVPAIFEEDVYARDAMVKFWPKVRKSSDHDQHLETLTKIVEAGFLREYVHALVVPATEEAVIATLRMKEFEIWRANNLQQHKAQTLTSIQG